MKVAVYARISSERQDIDFPILAPLKVLQKYDLVTDTLWSRKCVDEAESGGLLIAVLQADDCPSGEILKEEIRERYRQA
jgi:hypothetical protein